MNRKDSILIIEDNKVNRKVLVKLLQEKYPVLEAEDGFAALEILNKKANEIVAMVLDLNMPRMDGYEFMKKIADYPEFQNIPIIVETGDESKEVEKYCLELGAWDFIVKPYKADILKLRVDHAVERTRFFRNEHDMVTGIFNKNHFFRDTKQMLHEYKNEDFAFIFYDIDRFKLYNSFYGNAKGDKLLKYLGNILVGIANEEVCTYGSLQADKFALCIKGDSDYAEKIARRILREIVNYHSDFCIKPSIGIYMIKDLNEDISAMCDNAELAAGTCKYNVLKKIGYYDGNLSKQMMEEQQITNDVNAALQEEQFKVYLQPKYDVRTNQPHGAEALVRWVHPKKGVIPPNEFIPIFERNGFIGKLDFYVWDKVCAMIRRWIEEGKHPFPISVNVSRVNLYNPCLADTIIQLVKIYDIPEELFQIEITESAFTENQTMMQDTIKELKQAGFKILMDDFGSGYSSLNVLKDLDVDVLKIDMKFMPTANSNGKSEKILSSVVRMSKWIGMPVIAEGVETFEQVQFLRGIGCEYIQGYYFAKPMQVEEYEKLSDENSKKEEAGITKKVEKDLMDDLLKANSSLAILFDRIHLPICMFSYENGRVSILRRNRKFAESIGEITDQRLREEETLSTMKKCVETAVYTGEETSCEYMEHSREETFCKRYHISMQNVAAMGGEQLVLAAFIEMSEQKELF